MKDSTYKALAAAVDAFVRNQGVGTAKVSISKIAKTANISRATAYRYFDEKNGLAEVLNALNKSCSREAVVPIGESSVDRSSGDEVKRLKKELSNEKKAFECTNKLKSHQIELLWLENERLNKLVKELVRNAAENSNVVNLKPI